MTKKLLIHSMMLFLLILKNIPFGFGINFIDWIKISLSEEESCKINGGITTNYFKFEKDARQGDSLSANLLKICLEILFILIKSNKNIKSIKLFENNFL